MIILAHTSMLLLVPPPVLLLLLLLLLLCLRLLVPLIGYVQAQQGVSYLYEAIQKETRSGGWELELRVMV